jgi:diguanylate cyclase (GGDEF)-like protein
MPEIDDVAIDEEIRISPRIKFVNLRSLLTRLLNHLSSLLDSKRIGIYLRGRESGNWALAISRKLPNQIEEAARIINQESSEELKTTIQTRQPCLLQEILDAQVIGEQDLENLIIAPMWCENEVMGLLLADFDAFAALSDRHLIQLNLAAQIIKLGIEKEFLTLQVAQFEKTESQAALPEAENLLRNEQMIQWLLEREIERSIRHGSSFGVLTIGFDNLPHIITQHGENVADKSISGFVESLNYVVRKCDFLARRKGDKLLCISFEQNEAGAFVLAEKLRHKIKECVLMINNFRITATISIGIVLWPDGTKIKAQELLQRSEMAMLKAQEKGNRVHLWKSQPAD